VPEREDADRVRQQIRQAMERVGLDKAPPRDPAKPPPKPKPDERVALLDFPAAWEEYVEEEKRGDAGAVTWGWQTIDGGMGKPVRPGEVVIVGARTGIGKTWVAQHAIERKLYDDPTVGAIDFTMEMSAYQMAERFAGRAMEVSTRELAQRAIADEVTVEHVMAAAPYLERLRFFEATTSIDAIPEAIDLAEESMGIPVGIVVIDYTQLLAWTGSRNATLTEQATVNARRLKDVTKQRRVITIACAQLSRAAGRGDTEPSMESIRESGAAEEASDRILLFWRDPAPRDDDGKAIMSDYHEIRCKIEKNRHGPRGANCLIRFDHAMVMREVNELDLVGGGQATLDDDDRGDDVPF
jgi:replicative DNA helicase